jgi:hypothetical protein
MVNKGGNLPREFDLQGHAKEAPTMSTDDFHDLLYHLWTSRLSCFVSEKIRIRFHLLLLLAAYTETRPGALVGNGTESCVANKRYLQFEHCKLVLLKDHDAPQDARPLRVLEVTLKHRKNGASP